MELKDIKFNEINRTEFYRDVLNNAHNKSLRKIILSRDSDLIASILSFFQRNKDNSERLENELQRMDHEIRLRRITDGEQSAAYLRIIKLKRTLSLIYKYSYNDFIKFRSDFVEFVSFLYFAISTPFVLKKINTKRRFFHEPRIFYKSNYSLSKEIISNANVEDKIIIGEGENLIDLVHVNKQNSSVDFCECKADLNYFLLHLKNPNFKDENCIRSLKKWTYMNTVKRFFDKNIDKCFSKLYFFTFADTINYTELIDESATIINSSKICEVFSKQKIVL